MTNIRVHDEQYTEITREHTEPEWDNDDTYTSHCITGFEVTEEKSYYDLISSIEEFEYGVPYFLVFVLYDTGDSFGHYAGQIEYMDIFRDANLAYELRDKIEEDNKLEATYDGPDFKYTLDNEEEREAYTSTWKGYFESFVACKVERIFRER